MAGRRASSLTLRVVVFGSLWAIVALAIAGGLISDLYERTAQRGFTDLLTAQLYNLVNAVSVDEAGRLTGSPDLGDLRYVQPASGWYWEVVPASGDTKGRLTSGSLDTDTVASVPTSETPFGSGYRRSYRTTGLEGEPVRVIETEVLLDSDNHVARFRVMGDSSVVAADVASFDRTLFYYLGAVGLGPVVVNVISLSLALRPLTAVRKALAAVRNGRSDRLKGDFPTEVAPLAEEMNALIDNNRRIVERARTQVGNLAHSLKTPIAILVNEAGTIGGEHGRVVSDQSERMRSQVQQHLDRARVAAQSESVVYRTPVASVVDRLARVVGKLNPQLTLDNRAEASALVFAGEKQDLEEILGNLLDNAGKWAEGTIRVTAEASAPDRLAVVIEDDGPGLDESEIREARTRGRRFDETKPGSGFGLSIVSDLAAEYRGTLDLGRSELGGLSARVLLPRAG